MVDENHRRQVARFAGSLSSRDVESIAMTLHSPTLMRYLKALEQQVADAPRQAALLQAAFEEHGAVQALCTQLQAGPHLRTMALTALKIKAQVVPCDGLSTTLGSLSELVLRAARRVVLADLGSLCAVIDDAPAESPALVVSPFEHLDDWVSYVGHAVNGITQGWICSRELAVTEPGTYRAALSDAHRAMRHLGDSSRAAPFLHDAVNRSSWPALQDVCSRIWLALTIQFDVDPEMSGVVVSRLRIRF